MMFEIVVFVLAIVVLVIVIQYFRNQKDPLRKYEPVTEEELLLLTVVTEDLYEDLLHYVRTMLMSTRLQDYLSDKKDALESISYYMMLQVVRKEQQKKDMWEQDRIDDVSRSKSHVEKMIIQRIKQLK